MTTSDIMHSDQTHNHKDINPIRLLLISDDAFKLNSGISQLRIRLMSEPEDPVLYVFVEELVRDKPALREIIEDLLEELIRAHSKAARQTLSNIFSSAVTVEADDAYYADEFNRAIQLYSQALQTDPENKRARRQLEKIWSRNSSENLSTQIPRDAVQYFRMARSYVAGGDYRSAITFLNSAVDGAVQAGVQFVEATTLLSRLQDLEHSTEYKAQAEKYLREESWMDALDSYTKSARLEPSETSLSNLVAGLTELIQANEVIESLQQNPAALEHKIHEWRSTKEIEKLLTRVGETTLVTTALYRRVMQVYVNGLSVQLSELVVKVNSKASAESSDLSKALRDLMYKVLTDLPVEGQSETYKKLRGLFDESGNLVAPESSVALIVNEINAYLESTRRARARATFPWLFTAIGIVVLVVGIAATILRVVPSFDEAFGGVYFYLILGCLALIGSWVRSAKELVSLESINGNKSFELLMLKPLIGSGLALIVLLAIRSGLLVINVELGSFLYWAVSILVGYIQPAVDFILGVLDRNWITLIKGQLDKNQPSQ